LDDEQHRHAGWLGGLLECRSNQCHLTGPLLSIADAMRPRME
jgi:hypothetical protein